MTVKRDEHGWPYPPNGALAQWIASIGKAVIASVLLSMGWTLMQHRERLAVVESTMHRNGDALEHTIAENMAHAAIMEQVQRNTLLRDQQPEWFVQEFERLRVQIAALESRLQNIERLVR